ncbi:ATP-binding protein [Fodinicurvata fenggangensis]|uniref:ATP-binding protein n=1 Tax=Fodinicurvata fenggangensis TaxID=1121830 RepID=UPI00047C42C0|nr:ATP-binding protein [Fodinicurvata fenggangensis]
MQPKLTIETRKAQIDNDCIKTHFFAKSGQYILIAVGVGGSDMSPEVRAHACDPFFTTKATGEGTGLDLSMVYGFVEQTKGHINVYSELVEGTTVKLHFPCDSFDDEAESRRTIEKASQEGTARILVVENEMLVRETLDNMG